MISSHFFNHFFIMKPIFLSLLAFLLLLSTLHAQNRSDAFDNHALYADVGTVGVISGISLNYERKFHTNATGQARFFGRLGLAGTAIVYGPQGLGGLGGISLLTGKKNHHFMASGGIFVGKDYEKDPGSMYALPMLDIGYRFQRPQGGFLFQAKAGIFGIGIGIGGSF